MNDVAAARRKTERKAAPRRHEARERARASRAIKPGEGSRARDGAAGEPPAPGAHAFEAIDNALHANLARLTHGVIWSRVVHDYLLGRRQEMNDLMAWDADLTRMPYRMHSAYLRSLFLGNDLAQGRYEVDERPVTVSDVRAPMFAVSTVRGHVAPWRSVYKLHLLADADITFVLTSGGHNAGIVSEPGHPRRTYQIATRHEGDIWVDPDTWEAQTPRQDGSWWPELVAWLKQHSSGDVAPPSMGAPEAGYAPLDDAPGRYVHQP